MTTAILDPPPAACPPDQHFVLKGRSWEQYKDLQKHLETFGGGRASYLDGTLDITTLSLEHESRKSQIGRLLEAFLEKEGIEYFVHGSTTLESEPKRAGKEPDESYCFHEQKNRPDLAIEIAITRGGIDTLELYRRWEVPEVWIWHRDQLGVFVFEEGRYQPAERSRWFPGLDIKWLMQCARIESTSQARREFLSRLT